MYLIFSRYDYLYGLMYIIPISLKMKWVHVKLNKFTRYIISICTYLFNFFGKDYLNFLFFYYVYLNLKRKNDNLGNFLFNEKNGHGN